MFLGHTCGKVQVAQKPTAGGFTLGSIRSHHMIGPWVIALVTVGTQIVSIAALGVWRPMPLDAVDLHKATAGVVQPSW